MKRCPNPACGYIEKLPDIETCRKCGGPLIDDPRPPTSPPPPHEYAVGTLFVLILIITGLTVGTLFWETIERTLTTEWREWKTTLRDVRRQEMSKPLPKRAPDRSDTVKIGLAIPLSGDEAASGDMIRRGAQLMVEEINGDGGINGKKLELVIGDHRCDEREADAVLSALIQDDEITAIVAHTCYTAAIEPFTRYLPDSPVIVTPTITKYGTGPSRSFFRLAYTDMQVGGFLATYAHKIVGVRTVSILHDDTPYSIDVKDAFVEGAAKSEIAILSEGAYAIGTTDFTEALTEIRDLSPDCVLIVGRAREAGLILILAKKMGIKAIFLGTGGVADPELISIAGPAANGLIAVTPFLCEAGEDRSRAFEDLFDKRYSLSPDWTAAKAYDAVGIIAHALRKFGADRGTMRNYLLKMNSPQNGYRGLTGTIYFNDDGLYLSSMRFYYVKEGRFVRYGKK
jgi:branched-chain amino acid transport system substrate-binding protein